MPRDEYFSAHDGPDVDAAVTDVINSKESTFKSTTYASLLARLEAIESNIAVHKTNHAIAGTDSLLEYYQTNYSKNIKEYNATGDGSTNDYEFFAAMLTAIGSATYDVVIPKGIYKLATNVTIPSNIRLVFANGAILKRTNSAVITLNCGIEAGLYQIFDDDGSGSLAGSPRIKEVYPEWFGAVGDGVNDDTEAFRNVNIFLAQLANSISTGQLVSNSGVCLRIPNKAYKVIGDKIFGSILSDDEIIPSYIPYAYSVIADNATILWHISTDSDRLFFFDYSIFRPTVKNLFVFPIDANAIVSGTGGTIFHYTSYKPSGVNYANASKSHIEDVTITAGRNMAGVINSAKYIFNIEGFAMCDQSLILNCNFNYFETLFKSINPEAVNWTFRQCSMYGGEINSVYFDFTAMYDNFNVNNCSFSFYVGDIMLRTRSAISGGFYTQSPDYNFNFNDNRMEIYGSGDFTLCDINFGRLNMKNTNLKLGSGASTTKTIVSAYGLGNYAFENVNFYEIEFRFPILIAAAIIGVTRACGAYLKNCNFVNGKIYYKYTDGTDVFDLKDILIGTTYYRNVKFEDCSYVNNNSAIDFEITNCVTGVQKPNRYIRNVTYSTNGNALGLTYVLPPYQAIKNIKLSMPSTVPSTFDAFRVYFGDVTLANYVDYSNPLPTAEHKNEYLLFDGFATIFNDDLTLQSITVYILDAGVVVTGGVRSEISISYYPLDVRVFNITTNADTIVVREKVKHLNSGTTAQRPTLGLYLGQEYFDTTLGESIWYNGSAWIVKRYLTSISATPLYVGQEALVSNIWYKAIGTSSSADWKALF